MNLVVYDWNSSVTWLLGSIGLLTLFYRYITSGYDYFTKQNIGGPKPLLLVGNLWGLWKMDIPEHDLQLVKKYGKFIGTFDGFNPNLFIVDPELIKQVFIKDSDHFINRRDFYIEDKYVRMFVNLMKDQEWRDVRSAVSPTFTSVKIKKMTTLINKCTIQFVDRFREVAKKKGKLDSKEEFSQLTMDIIATCAFGMKIHSLSDKDNPFMSKARLVVDPAINRSPTLIIPFIFPKLSAKLSQVLYPITIFDFFIQVAKDALHERKISGKKYDDFIDLVVETIAEVSKDNSFNGGRVWNQEEMEEIAVAQSVLFLLAGYDTTATTLNNSMYYLAKNPDIQEQLYNDIQEQFETYGEISHEFVQNVPYADHFIHEVLRLHPPVIRLERMCNKDTQYGDIFIKEGCMITLPVYAIHHSAEHYPDPERFDPNRWTTEARATRSPYVYAPFGLGPRICVGMRFALEELKMVLCIMVKEFRFYPVDDTPEKIKVKTGFLFLTQATNMSVGIEERS